MATIQSLGLHEPSALSYLIAESILPSDAPRDLYRWRHQVSQEGNARVSNEILTTASCVVWSRNGTIKRVFNFDIEAESILHAFATTFSAHQSLQSSTENEQVAFLNKEAALVVILRTQAHIFLLSGDTHILPLSFEVQDAFPCAHGFLLQRRSDNGSSENDRGLQSLNGATLLDPGPGSDLHPTIFLPDVPFQGLRSKSRPARMPCTYSFTRPLSELGLVVAGLARKSEPFQNCEALPPNETIIYISTGNEVQVHTDQRADPVYLAVTINSKTTALTIWQVLFEQEATEQRSTRRDSKAENVPRRKSSNVYRRQTGAATPVPRGLSTFRESFGTMGQPLAENAPFQADREQISKQADDLASQLGHEFEQAGIQTRSARRVSSMLARTDLGAANDRGTFNDMALGPVGRKSLSRSVRRGESLGGFSDRQSFGRRRSSFQAASSIISDGLMPFDVPPSHGFDVDLATSTAKMPSEDVMTEASVRLSREVCFLRIKSLSSSESTQTPTLSSSWTVMTMLAPDTSTADDRRNRRLSVCIMNQHVQQMTIVNIAVKMPMVSSKSKNGSFSYELKAVETRRAQGIVDACRLSDGSAQRLLTMTRTRQGHSMMHLEAPWSASYRLDLPQQYRVFDRSSTIKTGHSSRHRDTGVSRVISATDVDIAALKTCESENQILLVDQEHRAHRVLVQLSPSSSIVRRLLDTINFVLPPEQHDSILVAWWEVKRWLEYQENRTNVEWVSLVVSVFLLAVPFVGKVQSKASSFPKKKKNATLRSSNGLAADNSQWEQMLEYESVHTHEELLGHSAWTWTTYAQHDQNSPKSLKNSKSTSSESSAPTKDTFLIRCANLARDFLQSPAGENAMGPEGYLPTAVNKERGIRRTALASILIGLHLIREEMKLDQMSVATSLNSSVDLALLNAQLGIWLGWNSWGPQIGTYYGVEITELSHWEFEMSAIDSLDIPRQPFEPPSILKHFESNLTSRQSTHFTSLLDLVSQSRIITNAHPLWKEAVRLTPRLFALTAYLSHHASATTPESIIQNMAESGVGSDVLHSIPDGIVALYYQAISATRGVVSTKWSAKTLKLLNKNEIQPDAASDTKRTGVPMLLSHDAVRDYRTISITALEAETLSRWDASSEMDRQAVTRLIFNEDRRFQEASKLVNQTRPPVIECISEPGWSESDLLEAQKDLAQYVTRRTLSVPAGRGMMHFNARFPMLTERVPVPAFSLQCIMKSQNSNDGSPPMTFSAEKSLFTEDKTSWAFFHNGASTGLMISKDARWIDTSWILYNKPPELTNRHAGFLLALGLNGHLRSLAKWVAFKYLTPKHTMISVGLLLGLAASYLGTMDTLVTRLLSVHVTCLLPPGAAELNISPLTQTTGLVGIGLLYHNSQHRRMSEVMLSEIENNDYEERTGDEAILRDEGYRLAAGFALGLINLGHGQKLHSLHDMGVVERLLTIAIGTKNVSHVHVLDRATAGAVIGVAFIFMKTNDAAIARKIDIPDTSHQFDYVRPDIFLLRTLARHLIMWNDITPTRDFITSSLPKAYRKRSDLSRTKRLSTDDLPFFNTIAGICLAMSLRFAGSHATAVRDLLVIYLDQFLRISRLPALNYDSKVTLNGIRNCLDVLALSCATVMAGSGDILVLRRLRALHGRTDKSTPFGSHLAAHMALGALFLSGGTATFGTSNLAVASLIMAFYPVFPTDVLDNRGHLQALRHLWVLAVDHRCLISRDQETGQIISSISAHIELMDGTRTTVRTPGLLPEFDSIHRIVFDHESYWNVDIDLTAIDKENKVNVRDRYKKEAKGLNVSLRRRAAHEKPSSDIFMTEMQALDEARAIPSVDPNAAVNERWKHGRGDTTGNVQSQNPLDWIFQLDAFKDLDHTDKALVLRSTGNGLANLSTASGRKLLESTAIDSILEFDIGTLGIEEDDIVATSLMGQENELESVSRRKLPGNHMQRDKLWQLRLLFACADQWDESEKEEISNLQVVIQQDNNETSVEGTEKSQTPRWISREVIERLRWRVWKMANEGQNQDHRDE